MTLGEAVVFMDLLVCAFILGFSAGLIWYLVKHWDDL
jgi:hypothetical protein